MNPFDSKEHWENAWQANAAVETSWHQDEPIPSLTMIRQAGLCAEDALIDVGGGASRLVDCLLDAGFGDLTVLDISTAALDQAQKRLGDRARHVKWIVSDITAFEPDRTYRLWHDRATFHFLTRESDRLHYVESLYRALVPGGQAVIASFAPGGPTKCSGLDIVQYDAEGLSEALGDGMQLREQAVEIHRTPAGRQQKFGFYRFERGA